MKRIVYFCVILSLFSFISCSARIDGSIAADGSASLTLNMSLGVRITALIRSMGTAGGSQNAPLLDSASINNSLAASPGISQSALRNSGASGLEGTVRISRINDFLTGNGITPDVQRSFLTFEHGASGGRLTMNVSRNNSREIAGMFSPEIRDYMHAFMAPFVTGDAISKAEYLELIEMFYNKPISDEIASSRVRVSIEFPGTITSVTGGTYSGRRAEFDLSLVDLLVLENPVYLEVRWR